MQLDLERRGELRTLAQKHVIGVSEVGSRRKRKVDTGLLKVSLLEGSKA